MSDSKKPDDKFQAELMRLFDKATDAQRQVDKENSFHNVRGSNRDVMIHIAVTVMPKVNGKTIIGEKENEICQFAAEIPAKQMPAPISGVKRMFEELTLHAYKRMLGFGLIRG